MIETELSRAATKIVEELGRVQSGETVVVVTDADTVDVARSIATAARSVTDDVSILVKPAAKEHSNEPSGTVTAAMRAVDVALVATRHSITHTSAMGAILDSGTRVVTLRSITTRMMREGGITADFDRVREDSLAILDAFESASTTEVTSPAGTDVTVGLTEHAPIALAGPGGPNDRILGFPPGEVAIAPDERAADGTVVFDHSVDNVGMVDEPIELAFVDGFVESVDGGVEAEELRRVLDRSDENARHVAEFAVGTNPDALLSENLKEAKKRLGTVHVAVGDNASTLGGSMPSDLHLDGVVLRPTVRLDGRTVLEEGVLQRDAVPGLRPVDE
jgi:leucyl aminopeptidase (aminopeptidase T)